MNEFNFLVQKIAETNESLLISLLDTLRGMEIALNAMQKKS